MLKKYEETEEAKAISGLVIAGRFREKHEITDELLEKAGEAAKPYYRPKAEAKARTSTAQETK